MLTVNLKTGNRYIELFLDSKPSTRPVPRRIPGRKNLMQDPPSHQFAPYSRPNAGNPYERSFEDGAAAVAGGAYGYQEKYEVYEQLTQSTEYSSYDYPNSQYQSTAIPTHPSRGRYDALLPKPSTTGSETRRAAPQYDAG